MEAFFIWNVYICRMYLLKSCGCSIQFAFLSVCRWLQYSCCSLWFSFPSFHCKGNSVSFFSRLPEMGSSIWCSGGIIKWLIVERLIFANGGVWCACWQKEILFCWVYFSSTEVKKDKKAAEGENANVRYIFVLQQFACWCFLRFLDDL